MIFQKEQSGMGRGLFHAVISVAAVFLPLLLAAGISFCDSPEADWLAGSCARDGYRTMECLIPGCWQDDDAYRLQAAGVPKKGIAVPEKRRASARESAVIMAAFGFIDQINAWRLKRVYRGVPKGTNINYTDETPPSRVFGPLAKLGTVIKEEYDEDDNCRIIYEIREKGLRKRVAGYLASYSPAVP